LDAVLEINNSLRNFEKNLQGLQTQWLAVKETQTPGEASVVPTVNAGLMADFASLERDIRFVKTNLVSIKQQLLGSDASKEILRLRESLELLKSELVGIKIQEQKVAAKVNPSEAGPYKYVVPPNLNPY
jgi:formiminotetrahydrofolate cyclodeaminase